MVARKSPAVRPALGADEHAGGAGEQQQRHDPRLRQRDVVAPGPERQRLAAEREHERHERGRERRRRRRRRAARPPSGLVDEGDEAARGDRERASAPSAAERGGEQARVGDAGDDDRGDEQRERDECGGPVPVLGLERGADDDDRRRDGGGDDREPRSTGPGAAAGALTSERIPLLQPARAGRAAAARS